MGVIWNSVSFAWKGITDINSWAWLLLTGVLFGVGIILTGVLAAIYSLLSLLGLFIMFILYLYPTARLDRRALELRGGGPKEFDLNKFINYIWLIILNILINLSCWYDKKFLGALVGFIVLGIGGSLINQPFVAAIGFILMIVWLIGVMYHAIRTGFSTIIYLTNDYDPGACIQKSWDFTKGQILEIYGLLQGSMAVLFIPLLILYFLVMIVFAAGTGGVMFLATRGIAPTTPNFGSWGIIFLIVLGIIYAAFIIGFIYIKVNLFTILGNTKRSGDKEVITIQDA